MPTGASTPRSGSRGGSATRWARWSSDPFWSSGARASVPRRARRASARRRGDEAALAHLASIVESSDDAIVSKTLDGIITTWNAGAERLYGYAATDALGRPIAIIIPPDRPNELLRILARLKRGEHIES